MSGRDPQPAADLGSLVFHRVAGRALPVVQRGRGAVLWHMCCPDTWRVGVGACMAEGGSIG